MTHQHLSLQSLHSLKSNTHHDDDGGTADGQILHGGNQDATDDGQQCYHRQVQCAKNQDLVDNLLDEVRGGLTGAEAGDKATVLLQIVGDLSGIVLYGDALLII